MSCRELDGLMVMTSVIVELVLTIHVYLSVLLTLVIISRYKLLYYSLPHSKSLHLHKNHNFCSVFGAANSFKFHYDSCL